MEHKETVNIKIEHIHPHPDNPRKDLGDLTELADSIKKNGIMQNLTVIPVEGQPGEYLALIGNRRSAAARLAGIREVPCRIVENLTPKEQLAIMLEENMQRNDLTIYEQAQGFQMMLDLGDTEEQIAEKTGFSRTTVRHRINIAKLNQEELKKKQQDEGFQLTLKDLYILEKVEDIEERNRILSVAADSRDLARRAQSFCENKKKEADAKKIIQMLEDAGVKPAPKRASQEIYYVGKWQTIEIINYGNDTIPDSIEIEDDAELFYLKYWNEIRVIKKAPKVERKETEEDRKRKQADANKKQLEAIADEMNAIRRDFILDIISGKIESIKDTTEIQKSLWQLIYETEEMPSRDRCIVTYCGKTSYWDIKEEQKAEAEEWADKLDMFSQMLITAFRGCEKQELVEWQAGYNGKAAGYISRLYEILALYGLHIDKEEQKQVLDGTHELYTKKEEKND